MNGKKINMDILSPQEQSAARLEYSSPVLEEYGDLHKLTHGDIGEGDDSGPAPLYYDAPGIVGP